MKLNNCFLLVVVIMFYACEKSPLPGNQLVEVNRAQSLLESPNVKFIDCRPFKNYSDGHIPKAVNITREEIASTNYSYGGMMIEKEGLEKVLSSKGLTNKDYFVLYDDRGGCEATRLLFILHEYGFDKVAILNGGLISWKANAFKVTNEINKTTSREFKLGNEAMGETWNCSISEVKDHLSRGGKLVDCRSLDEYNGLRLKKGASHAGKIPGAMFIDFTVNSDHDKATCFTDLDSLEVLYSNVGLKKNDDIIVYCQSGVRSSHTTYVLRKLLGFANVRNYDGSWIEYSYLNKSDSIITE